MATFNDTLGGLSQLGIEEKAEFEDQTSSDPTTTDFIDELFSDYSFGGASWEEAFLVATNTPEESISGWDINIEVHNALPLAFLLHGTHGMEDNVMKASKTKRIDMYTLEDIDLYKVGDDEDADLVMSDIISALKNLNTKKAGLAREKIGLQKGFTQAIEWLKYVGSSDYLPLDHSRPINDPCRSLLVRFRSTEKIDEMLKVLKANVSGEMPPKKTNDFDSGILVLWRRSVKAGVDCKSLTMPQEDVNETRMNGIKTPIGVLKALQDILSWDANYRAEHIGQLFENVEDLYEHVMDAKIDNILYNEEYLILLNDIFYMCCMENDSSYITDMMQYISDHWYQMVRKMEVAERKTLVDGKDDIHDEREKEPKAKRPRKTMGYEDRNFDN